MIMENTVRQCNEVFRGGIMDNVFRILLWPIVFCVCVFTFAQEGGGEPVLNNVRKSVIAGAWYPGEPQVLHSTIREYLNAVSVDVIDGDIISLVAPHAGYVYSGQVAAYAYKLLEGKEYEAVVVIGPSHRTYFQGASVYREGGYETPLGVVSIDGALADEIIDGSDMIATVSTAHAQEHSVEIQLPFLQVVLGDFKFVPIVMGSQDRRTCEELADVLYKVIKTRKILVVASSDLSHFHRYDQAVSLDSVMLAHMEKMNSAGLLADLAEGNCEACGGGPVVTAMMYAARQGARGSEVLKYANSGDITGDKRGVVGYAAAVFFRTSAVSEQARSSNVGTTLGLSADEKAVLLGVARAAIRAELSGERMPGTKPHAGALSERRGAFVTLKKRGQLRGCIGSFEARGSLYETVSEMARSAAFHDPRFTPMGTPELEDVTIEISALTPLKKIDTIDEIEVGRHGIYIVRGMYRGVLLPQVATDHRWDKVTFLEETCHKAGLPSGAWQDKETEIYIFSADIFGEGE